MTAAEAPTTALGGEPGFVVQLDQFSGPLDLLLHLLREQQIEIADIPIAKIADQFLSAIHELGLNQAADYLDMASRLVRLKAQMLLPRRTDDDGWEDPRAELVRRLLEYQQIKEVALWLQRQADRRALQYARGYHQVKFFFRSKTKQVRVYEREVGDVFVVLLATENKFFRVVDAGHMTSWSYIVCYAF